MFNKARFNLTRFNVPSVQVTIIYLYANALETVDGVFALAQNAHILMHANMTIGARTDAVQGIRLQAIILEELGGSASSFGRVMSSCNALESIFNFVELGANVHGGGDITEDIAATMAAIAIFHLQVLSQESVLHSGTLGADIYARTAAYEILSSVAELEAQDKLVIIIDETFLPGDTIVIDSDNYTVLKNGENILHKHTGDWAWISRNTRSIKVETGTAAELNISMLYTERYL